MTQTYIIKHFYNSIPVNHYVPLSERERVAKLMTDYSLVNYFSTEVVHYRWSTFSRLLGHQWLEPSKQTIEFVFNLTFL